jgi:predicted GIY-YIG superfamily endonuclease
MLYLLHFDPRYRHAGHYLGYTEDLPKRFAMHLQGKGSPLVKAAVNHGSRIILVRIWAEDGNAEQEIKRVVRSGVRLCPVCNDRAALRMTAYKSVMVHLRNEEEIRQALASLSRPGSSGDPLPRRRKAVD